MSSRSRVYLQCGWRLPVRANACNDKHARREMLDALKAHVQRGLGRQLPPHVDEVKLDLVTQRRPCGVPGPHDLDEAAKETSEGWVRGAR